MSFCKNFRKKIKSLIARIGEEVLQHADIALMVTEAIKKFLESPVANMLTAIIPGNVDNQIQFTLINALEAIIPTFSAASKCNEHDSISVKLKCLNDYLKSLTPDALEGALIKLASLITAKLHNNKLSQNEYDTATQVKFSLNK